eukprot:m.267552 g.267552  ORF g.267552 m.267552 type:complete len:869 (+) comp40516_c0_seq13:292-2898(+)
MNCTVANEAPNGPVNIFIGRELVDNFVVVLTRNAYLAATAIGLVWMMINLIMHLTAMMREKTTRRKKIPSLHVFSFPGTLFCFLHLFILDISVSSQKTTMSSTWIAAAAAPSRYFSFLMTAWEGIQLMWMIFACIATVYYERDIMIPSKVVLFLYFGSGLATAVLLLGDAQLFPFSSSYSNMSAAENRSKCVIDWRKMSVWTDYTDLFYPTTAMTLLAFSLVALLVYKRCSGLYQDYRERTIVKAFAKFIFICGASTVAAVVSVLPSLVALTRATDQTEMVPIDSFNALLWKMTAIAFPLPSISTMLLVLYHEKNDIFKNLLRRRLTSGLSIVRISFTKKSKDSVSLLSSKCCPSWTESTLYTDSSTSVESPVLRKRSSVTSSQFQGSEDCVFKPVDPPEEKIDILKDFQNKTVQAKILGTPFSFTRRERCAQTLGQKGGQLKLESTGITVSIPAGAVDDQTKITAASFLPVESTQSSIVTMTEVMPHRMVLRKTGNIRFRHHLCLNEKFRIRVLYHSGTSLTEQFQLIADLGPEKRSACSGETEIKLEEHYVLISCLGFSRYCTIQEGVFYLAFRIYAPIAFHERQLDRTVCVTVSCQCSEVVDYVDEEQRRQSRRFVRCVRDGLEVETIEKIDIAVGEIDPFDQYSIKGNCSVSLSSKILKPLVGEEHFRFISKDFRLRLSPDLDEGVTIPVSFEKISGAGLKDTNTTEFFLQSAPDPTARSSRLPSLQDQWTQNGMQDHSVVPYQRPTAEGGARDAYVSMESLQSVNERPTSRQIFLLAKEIGFKWKDLARNLRPTPLDYNQVACIEYKHARDLHGQASCMLELWVSTHGSRASVGLCSVLHETDLRLQAEIVFSPGLVKRILEK